jgi:DMSO reductase family type II enzyme molybdopterin subunit
VAIPESKSLEVEMGGHRTECDADATSSIAEKSADAPALGQDSGAINRRRFLKVTLSLTLVEFASGFSPDFVRAAFAATKPIQYTRWEDIYRRIWKWDSVTWGSHTNACSPGTCLFHVYAKNGLVWREEQVAKNRAPSPAYSDSNPMGCQKGCAFHTSLYSKERVKYPLKRAGERGQGKWQRISWDQALTEIADSILDAHAKGGVDNFVVDGPHVHAGNVASAGMFRFTHILNAVLPDHNVEIGDTFLGLLVTFGKMQMAYSADNFFDAEFVVLTHQNWSYTAPALYHFLTEARYNGTEIALLAPDASPTTHAVDTHIPVIVGSDSAFWLSVCHEIVEQHRYDAPFVKEQTDLPILVRTDTRRFLRAVEVDGGREDQLYFFDSKAGRIARAPRGTLRFDGDPALAGEFSVTLKNGSSVRVTPVFEILRSHLQAYTPEKAQALCGVHPSVIREMALKVATKRTCFYIGFSSGKHYHGDLMERSLLLAAALTGNIGKPGTGCVIWAFPADGISLLASMQKPLAQGGLMEGAAMVQAIAERMKKQDPEITDELINIEVMKVFTRMGGYTPSVFWLHNHVGYDKLWNRRDWQDPAMKRSFREYMDEAVKKGWWDGLTGPAPGKTPEVMMFMATNPLRRVRSGNIQYPQVLFPKLKTIFTIETRLSSTAMFCDYVLPAAWYYEKEDMTLTMVGVPYITLIQQAVKPVGEAKSEWEIFSLLLKRIGERAAARGMEGFVDRMGQMQKYSELQDKYTMHGAVNTAADGAREMAAINAAADIVPRDYTYEQFEKDGTVYLNGMGTGFQRDAVANEFDPKKPFYSLRWHTEKKLPYPTLARRIQFYIDHEWYLEVGEELPVHKDVPPFGGNYPFRMTSGHARVSINSIHLTNPVLSRLHRSQPVVFMNNRDAQELGIQDGEMVRVFNDVGEFEIMTSLQAAVSPKQVIVYFWEPYQFRDWKNMDGVAVGQPKALWFAGGYEQLRYFYMHGSPMASVDRGVRVGIERIGIRTSNDSESGTAVVT